jgi:hypothetical protein
VVRCRAGCRRRRNAGQLLPWSLSRGRRRERGGIAGGRRLQWPLVAERECGLGILVKVAKFSNLPFQLSNAARRPIPLHALAACQDSVLFDVDFAGATRGGVVDGERRGGKGRCQCPRVLPHPRTRRYGGFLRRGESTAHLDDAGSKRNSASSFPLRREPAYVRRNDAGGPAPRTTRCLTRSTALRRRFARAMPCAASSVQVPRFAGRSRCAEHLF